MTVPRQKDNISQYSSLSSGTHNLSTSFVLWSLSSDVKVDKDVLFMMRNGSQQVQALVAFRHDPDSDPGTNMVAHKPM